MVLRHFEIENLESRSGGGSAFDDRAALDLARQLQKLSLIDPTDVLARVSAGDKSVLPRFATPPAEVSPRSWDSIERAKPGRLSPNQYQQFLEGKSPSPEIELPDLDKDVVSYLRESRRDWLVFGTGAAVSAIVGGLAGLAVISLEWLQGVALVFALVAGASAFRTVKQGRSLLNRSHEAKVRSQSDFKIKSS